MTTLSAKVDKPSNLLTVTVDGTPTSEEATLICYAILQIMGISRNNLKIMLNCYEEVNIKSYMVKEENK